MNAEVGHYALVFALIQSVLPLTGARVPEGALMAVVGHGVSR